MKVLAQPGATAAAASPVSFLDGRLALLVRLSKFSVVGGSGVFVNFGMLYLLHGLLRLPLLVAAPLAVEMAILNNFLWNNFWTFDQRSLVPVRFFKFNLTCLGSLAISVGTLYLLVHMLGWHYLLANLIGIAVATGWNFSLSLVWTWKARPELLS